MLIADLLCQIHTTVKICQLCLLTAGFCHGFWIIIVSVHINVRQKIVIAFLFQPTQKFRRNLYILQTEKEIVPAGHLCLNRQKLRLQCHFFPSGPICCFFGISCKCITSSQFSLIHPAHSQIVFADTGYSVLLSGNLQFFQHMNDFQSSSKIPPQNRYAGI